eukprot:223930-Amphidinium_carterae.1
MFDTIACHLVGQDVMASGTDSFEKRQHEPLKRSEGLNALVGAPSALHEDCHVPRDNTTSPRRRAGLVEASMCLHNGVADRVRATCRLKGGDASRGK